MTSPPPSSPFHFLSSSWQHKHEPGVPPSSSAVHFLIVFISSDLPLCSTVSIPVHKSFKFTDSIIPIWPSASSPSSVFAWCSSFVSPGPLTWLLTFFLCCSSWDNECPWVSDRELKKMHISHLKAHFLSLLFKFHHSPKSLPPNTMNEVSSALQGKSPQTRSGSCLYPSSEKPHATQHLSLFTFAVSALF